MLPIVLTVLVCLVPLVWMATKQPPRTPEVDRRLDLVDHISKAAALLVQANFTHDPVAAHELERDAAGMLRDVLEELPGIADSVKLHALSKANLKVARLQAERDVLRQQLILAPEVCRD